EDAARMSRDVLRAALAGLVLALVMTWPLMLHLGSDIPKDLGDPLLQTWQVAWIGHALLEQPLDLWQANTFWPYADTLAFSDALVGYAPAGLVAQVSPHMALVVYDLLFLGAYALAFLGTYLLARELGLSWPGAAAAGVAFAYAPWKLAQNGHLHVLSSGGIPLALFLLVRGYRRRSPGLVIAGWLVAAWQMTLGFTLGLQLGYLLGVLAIVALVTAVRRPALRPGRRVAAATAIGVLVLVLVSVLMARPYLRVIEEHPEARRTPAYVEGFSPQPRSFLAAPEQSWLWGDLTSRVRAPLSSWDEMSLFPGLAIAVLALVGALGHVLPRRLRIGLAIGVVACAALSLGVRDVSGPGKYLTPYRLLFDFAPGWDGVRTPGRINTLTSLGLALLVGAGACVIVRTVRGRSERLAPLVGVALVAAILLEGLGPLAHPRVPAPPAAVRLAAEPQLELPAGFRHDALFSYWSTAGFPETVNGAGGFDPTGYDRLRKEVSGFPDAASVSALRLLGVRSVLLHPERAAGTAWEGAADKPIAGLPLEREVVDGVVLFHVR
ncbi:MAG TPA: hypothetical protein VLA22_02630, partial [Gaiellaceae bacterium]|nr:hypothetical protein [Gaiellaceae bacterium]